MTLRVWQQKVETIYERLCFLFRIKFIIKAMCLDGERRGRKCGEIASTFSCCSVAGLLYFTTVYLCFFRHVWGRWCRVSVTTQEKPIAC